MKKIVKLLFIVCISLYSYTAYAQDAECQRIYNRALTEMNSGKYETAIRSFGAASKCDESLSSQCNAKIEECRKLIDKHKKNRSTTSSGKSDNLSVSKSILNLPTVGGTETVTVSGVKDWEFIPERGVDWYKVQKSGTNKLIVICDKPNEYIPSRKSVITVKSGNNTRTIELTQQGTPEYLRVSTSEIAFSAKGNSSDITVYTNTAWEVSNVPFWCEVSNVNKLLSIRAKPNNTSQNREGTITISTRNKELKIKINQFQLSNTEVLDASKKLISFTYMGGKQRIDIYSNTADWKIGDFPKWCNVEKIDGASLQIECLKNNTLSAREETILVRTDKQTIGIKVSQPAGVAPVAVPKAVSSRVIGGRNVSFGITAGMVLPSFKTSASSDYLGSAVNYAYGSENEKADYKSEVGFTVGLVADIRLVDNFYLQTGINYTNINMKNSFSGVFDYKADQTSTTYVEGKAYDDYTEKYTLNYIEIPFLFSYRFKLSDKINWQVAAGPYIGYGISGKNKIKGTTDYPSLIEYYNNNNAATGNSYIMNCVVTGELDMFGKKGWLKESFTTGEQPEYDNDFEFKSAPFKKLNAGVTFGTGIEIYGFNIGIYYDLGLTNIAEKDFWESNRMEMSDYKGSTMTDYKHKINKLQLKVGYIYRW